MFIKNVLTNHFIFSSVFDFFQALVAAKIIELAFF